MCEDPYDGIGPIERRFLIETTDVDMTAEAGWMIALSVGGKVITEHKIERKFHIKQTRLYKVTKIGGFDIGYVGMFLGQEIEE